MADSAEARCRAWLCSLACAGRRVAAGSGGLFIAKLLYQTPGSSLFSCCCCLVGCRYKLDCRRCGELPGGSLPDDCSHRRSSEISATPYVFFNYKKPARKSGLMSQGGTVLCFSPLASLAVRCVSFQSCVAQGSLITMLRGKDGLCSSYFNLFDPSKEARSLMIPWEIDLLHPFRAHSWKFTAGVHCLYSEGNKLIYSHADQFRT